MQILKYGWIGLGAIFLTTPTFASTGLDSSIEWTNYRSCIDLTTSLKKYLASSELSARLLKSNYAKSDKNPLINQQITSQTYFSYLDKNQQLLYLFKGAQESKTNTVNIAIPTLLAKFHLPKSRKHIQTFFYQDKKLIISAEENQNSLIAIYTIEDKSFKPLKYYKMSGPFKQAQLVGDKFYLITQKQTTKDSLEALLKANGEDNNFFPKLEQAIKYGLKTTIISQATCQKIAHNITDGELPNLTSLAIFNLNSLDTEPEIKHFLGQLNHIAIGPEYLYFLKPHNNTDITCKNCSQKAEGSGEKTLIQGFSLDPKLYQSNNAILSGTLLSSKNYLTEDFKLEIPLYQTSGKMKQYRILQADNKLSTFTTTILAETGSNYQNITKESGSYQLSNDETTLIITQNKNQYLLPTSERRKNQLFTLGNNLIKIQNTNNAITITNNEIGQSKGETLLSLNNAELLDNIYRNSEQKILSLITRENGKTTLRGYDLGDPKEAKLLFKRTYPVLSNLKHLDLYINMEKYTVLIAQGIADFFVTRNHTLTKTIKIK
ncbi:hypothetical protein D8B45_00490 [Candidatus Gracilibacteria bacterium]|nr:MAG: hypothetical protein D8B45_00490 [Candidatus Gracilibacteria bacterium]